LNFTPGRKRLSTGKLGGARKKKLTLVRVTLIVNVLWGKGHKGRVLGCLLGEVCPYNRYFGGERKENFVPGTPKRDRNTIFWGGKGTRKERK